MSWNKISQKCSISTKSLFLSHFVHKCIYIPVSEHFSFAKIIHPPDRCDISKSWLNSMIITQVHLVLRTKGHSKICSCHTTQCNRCFKLRERAIGMLPAEITARASVRKCHVHFSTISCLQCRFRDFGSTSNRPHNRRPHLYGVVWASHLLMSTLWTECPMVAVGLWYGQA